MGEGDKVDGFAADGGNNERAGESKEHPSEDEATPEEIQDAKDFLDSLARRRAERTLEREEKSVKAAISSPRRASKS